MIQDMINSESSIIIKLWSFEIKKDRINDLLTGLLGPYKEIRSLIFFVRPELARTVRESEGFVFLVPNE